MGRDRERWGGIGRCGEGQGEVGGGQAAVGRDWERWGGIGGCREGQGALGRDRESWEGTARGGKR